jgi:cytochrome b
MTHTATTPSFGGSTAVAAPAANPRGRRVTDAPTRMAHWLFALSFVLAYLTGDSEHWRALHVAAGYTLAGVLVFRLLYGLFGPRQARLSALLRKLAGIPGWLRATLQGSAPTAAHWRQGQNLLMAVAIAALLLGVLPLTLSGYATYNEWGGERLVEVLEELHEFFGNFLLLMVLAHLALIAGLSALRRKNQALPMLTGRVEGNGPDLARRNHAWLAALLLVAVLGYGAWEWQQAPDGLLPSASERAAGFSGSGGHDDHDED